MIPEPMSTSLGKLSEHDWNRLRNRWARGIDWMVEKLGKHWIIGGGESFGFGLNFGFPLFKTKTAAYDAITTLIMRESSHRSWRQMQQENVT